MPASRDHRNYDTTREVEMDRVAPTFVRAVDRLREKRNALASLDDGELTQSEARRVRARLAEYDRTIAALETKPEADE